MVRSHRWEYTTDGEFYHVNTLPIHIVVPLTVIMPAWSNNVLQLPCLVLRYEICTNTITVSPMINKKSQLI